MIKLLNYRIFLILVFLIFMSSNTLHKSSIYKIETSKLESKENIINDLFSYSEVVKFTISFVKYRYDSSLLLEFCFIRDTMVDEVSLKWNHLVFDLWGQRDGDEFLMIEYEQGRNIYDRKILSDDHGISNLYFIQPMLLYKTDSLGLTTSYLDYVQDINLTKINNSYCFQETLYRGLVRNRKFRLLYSSKDITLKSNWLVLPLRCDE